jgi:hypothetical protein
MLGCNTFAESLRCEYITIPRRIAMDTNLAYLFETMERGHPHKPTSKFVLQYETSVRLLDRVVKERKRLAVLELMDHIEIFGKHTCMGRGPM